MKTKIILIAILLSVFISTPVFATYGIQTKISGCTANQSLPDSECTPGAVLTTNTKVICVVGYTKTVRDVSTNTKKKVFKEYGIPWAERSNYEVDHLISLELGGSNDISNLFPESHLIKNNSYTKDAFENYLHKQVCSGKLSISDAQDEISSNWVTYNTTRLNPTKTPVVKTTTPPVIPTKTETLHIPVPIPQTITPPEPTPVITNVQPTISTPQISVTPTSDPTVKKSTTGICHAIGTTYYSRTLNYTAYSSIADCLASGGRLPVK